jgi:hypothetical protein
MAAVRSCRDAGRIRLDARAAGTLLGAPTPATVLPRLRTALVSQIVVEQAKGYLRERLGVSTEDAFHVVASFRPNP